MRRILAARDPFWPGQVAALAAILLYFALPGKLTIGPTWLLPVLEGSLLVTLFCLRPTLARGRRNVGLWLALGMTGLVGLATLVALGLLAHYLARGGHTGGERLLEGGVVIWVTLVLIFAIAFWEIDRNGPIAAAEGRLDRPDFLFPQMSDDARRYAPDWTPGFPDYLYLSLTNATAFSPTDTMPLTYRAKALMGVQSVAALATIGLVIARAVNVLT